MPYGVAAVTAPSPSAKSRPGPLQGIRVLDFTAMLAGPHCARLMADLGAEVIKVEGLEGDMIRGRPPLRDGNSSYFGALNCGKKSLSIDLKSEAAKPIIHQLAGLADVVVENFRPGVMARLGFDYVSLKKHNPKLIYCSISGYGQSGSGATRAAYAPIVHAASGYDAANLSYQAEQEYPASTGIFVADILSGAYAFGAIQAALVHRERTGEGQAVDVSLMDSMLNLMVFECQEAQFPSQQKRPVYAPMKSRDGHVIIAPISQKNFEQMADAMQRPDLKTDERFATNGGRVRALDRADGHHRAVDRATHRRRDRSHHGRGQRSLLPLSHRRGRHEGSATGRARQPRRDRGPRRVNSSSPTRPFSFRRRRRQVRRSQALAPTAGKYYRDCSACPTKRSTACESSGFFRRDRSQRYFDSTSLGIQS